MPFTTTNPLVIKERGGDSNTRVIIKVGYNAESWDDYGDNININIKDMGNGGLFDEIKKTGFR